MANWEYEIVTGTVDEVREQLNVLGALSWEIVSTGALPDYSVAPELIVYLRRSATPDTPDSQDTTVHDFPTYRAQA